MKTILINVYACNPYMGSEPGLGWNWVKVLGKQCNLHVITEGEWKENIELELSKLPYKDNIKFYYNPLPNHVRKMCWNQGDWRFYYYYDKWQKKTLDIANEIVISNRVDIIHQLNMVGFREPGYLWKIKDIPFIWGPVDAKEKFPLNYTNNASIKVKLFLLIKNLITKLQLKYSYKLRKAVNKASIIVSSSGDSVNTFKKYFAKSTILIHDTACEISELNYIENTKDIFDILWVGKFDFRKQLELALNTISEVKDLSINFHIVGGSKIDEVIYKKIAINLGINDKCIWYGTQSHDQIAKIMQANDLFFFTSVAEGTPTVVSEAICNHLPVLCFDTCGQANVVNSNVGFKIKLSNPDQSVIEFAEIIRKLYNNKNLLKTLKQNCVLEKKFQSWEYRSIQMIDLYNKLLY